ncbi:serine/threonine-protein kinase [Dokdonella fugitiva]|jgi:non-specific serine/threonine protein kinase/serine/threonine-protein kinase|uniref:serine/threonine-protein kinase n=1 Tax=Dokdonella fugitiva TaxID=328517 RepID=UPI0015FD6AC6|nr:serine/threonine-protein kinase [Dokdonella fugitiva]MBA8883603.1 non-specific serine/threonine protein kinase/serine/threonine-protein kinase [Dokdonella fugitiva]
MHGDETSADDATEFIGRTAATGSAEALEPGMQLGPYLIRSVLGEGGMGRVYLAEQLRPVHRDVALKLIREQVASPLARAYFDVERQALAQMQHPAIAQVFDAGTTEQGYPYLAMEVVEGVPITRFCREQQLGRDARLALFARVCHGVQHAHQKGIIHRDLKPANVLVRRVDGTPMPKIIDFGIAIGGTASGDGVAASTTSSDRAGTTLYMSPEQALQPARGIDTRSDVYSLGVMLYEVLTDADASALNSVAHHSTRAPQQTLLAAIDSNADADGAPDSSALLAAARRLPPELRAILRKALAIERTERYDSAAALADDLERFREQRPVKALPPTRWYLARKFVARHRLGLGATMLVALALVAGTLLALRGLAMARQEAAKAERVSGFVRSMLAGIDPDRARGMDNRLLRSILDAAADRASRELAAQPDVRAEIERTIASSYSSLGEFALAGSHFDAAVAAAREARLPPAASADIASQRALGLNAAGHSRDALDAAEAAFALVADLPADDRGRLLVESRLASIERDAGRLDAARARYARVIEQQEKVLGSDDEATLESEQGLAIADFLAGRFADARPRLQRLIATYRAHRGAEDIKTVGAQVSLAVLENEDEHPAQAVELLAPLLPVVEKVYGVEHPRTLVVVMNLGSALRSVTRYDEARPYYLRALELARKLYGDRAPRTLMAEGNLSLMLRDAGDLAEAERHARFVADNAEKAFGDNPYRAAMYRGYATVLTAMGRYADAERELDRAWSVFTSAPGYGPDHPRAQEVVDSYVALYDAWKKPDKKSEWAARKHAAAAAG